MLFANYDFFKVNFVDPASPLMYGIIELHDHIFFFLNMILFLVLFLIATTIKFFVYDRNSIVNRYLLSETVKTKYEWLKVNHGVTIEIIWTIVPSLVLILIAIPSFALLYATDELVDPSVTIQVMGHQWYWSYEYNDLNYLPTCNPELKNINNLFIYSTSSSSDLLSWALRFNQSLLNKTSIYSLPVLTGSVEFDSYMKQESDLQFGEKRLYETDFPLVLPKFTHIRFMITADDVIHSWSVPSLGIKVDAVPGRINTAHTYIKKSGVFYGQCSELCGVNHAFMPIQILVFEPSLYYDYIRLSLLNK